MRLNFFIILLTLSLGACSSMGHKYHHKTDVTQEVVNYSTTNTELQGVLFKPENKVSKGGILVVHEWYGLNAYAKKRAEKLAKMGYTTFAVDMYGKGKLAKHPKTAKKFMQASLKDPKELKRKFEAAIKVITHQGGVDKNKIVSIGYCFGGGISLNMARAGFDLLGVASFHGSLRTDNPVKKGDIKGKVLVANGGADPMVPAKDVTAFVKEMHEAEVDFKFLNFKGVQHSFTVKGADKKGEKYGLPMAYNKRADKQSWHALIMFLTDVF